MMNLPNYFLADLPDASTLSGRLITDACQTLKQNRSKYLAGERTENLINIVARLACEWLEPEFPFRKVVLDEGPGHTGFSRETLALGLDRYFSQITAENLRALVVQDLGSGRRLDEFVSGESERKQNRSSLARGPELLVHISGGVLPNPPFTSMILGLLARSAQFVKCATGSAFLPRIFAHSLYASEPKLASCMEVAEWAGGREELENALFGEAECITVTGSDETIKTLRGRIPVSARLIEHGHKVSFAYVGREALEKPEQVIRALAQDVAAWNQLGCLSPQAIYVEKGTSLVSEEFAALLASELAAREQDDPRGVVSDEDAAAISARRMVYQVRASADPSTKIWSSENSTAWTVVHENILDLQPSCLNRFIHVKPVENIEQLLAVIEPLRGKISTVAVAAPLPRMQELALRFAGLAVTRICRAGQMQSPPISWRHDGRPSLGELISWTDLEL